MNEAALHIEKKPGYKKTKLGWIPEKWDIEKLSKLTEKIGSGITPRGGSEVYTTNGHPFIRSQNVGWGRLLLEDMAHIPIDIHESMISTELKYGDVLLNITGASIGRSALATEEIKEGNVNQHVCIIRPKKSIIDERFLNSFLISWNGQKQIESFQAGGNRQGLNFQQIGLFKIPLPPLPEQKKIADILSTWDRAIETLEQLIAKKEELKRGLMQELLSGNKRFPGFEGEWKMVRFKDVVNIDSKSLNSKTDPDYTFQYISLSDVENGVINTELETHIYNSAPSRAKRVVTEGDILMATVRPNLQAFAMAQKEHHEMIASTGFAVLSPKKGFNNKYLYHYLFSHHISSQIFALIVGSNYPAINSKDVKKLKIRIPPTKEEVDRIESVFTSIDDEIKILMMQKEMVTEQKKGLMQQLLTGKTRVKA